MLRNFGETLEELSEDTLFSWIPTLFPGDPQVPSISLPQPEEVLVAFGRLTLMESFSPMLEFLGVIDFIGKMLASSPPGTVWTQEDYLNHRMTFQATYPAVIQGIITGSPKPKLPPKYQRLSPRGEYFGPMSKKSRMPTSVTSYDTTAPAVLPQGPVYPSSPLSAHSGGALLHLVTLKRILNMKVLAWLLLWMKLME